LTSHSPDIKTLTISNPGLASQLAPAFEKYNEEQFITIKLPGSSQQVIVSSYNSLGDGRYYDVESSSSFEFNHTTRKASAVQSHTLEGPQSDLVYESNSKTLAERPADEKSSKSSLKSVSSYVKEHFANAACGVYAIENDSKIAVIIVANKYSPNNFWYVAN
jgi:hypothetical protein